MHFNIGSIFSCLSDHKRAITAFNRAITKDTYFAVGYFQRGVSLFLLGNLESAKNDFDSAFHRLRGNSLINYQQLGLQFRLYSCEVLFNRGICQLYLGNIDAGLTDLYNAQKSKETEEHDIIDQAVRARGKGYSVYSIPPGLLFRPSELRLRQLKGIDMFQDKLPYSFAVSNRKNSIFLYQPTDEEIIKKKEQQQTMGPSPINTISSSSSSSSLHSPISPVTPSYSTKSFSRRLAESGIDATRHNSMKENHRQSTNNASNHRQSFADNENRNRPKSMANIVPPTLSINSSQSSLVSHHSLSTSTGKLKIKCHYTDTRILLTPTDINFQELKKRIAEKFNTSPDSIQLAYKDEVQEKVLIIDDEDLEMARQINRSRQHKPYAVEKLEIWI
ncbi:MAG: hypothetical protein EXX96DRAFT_602155 [Benjaminiella poitrasii]|nr:MAG: hypothetical protein EXX96DRAFT_602155 [Benjaminiella poitrasii]